VSAPTANSVVAIVASAAAAAEARGQAALIGEAGKASWARSRQSPRT
jgi:hypothetical protein